MDPKSLGFRISIHLINISIHQLLYQTATSNLLFWCWSPPVTSDLDQIIYDHNILQMTTILACSNHKIIISYHYILQMTTMLACSSSRTWSWQSRSFLFNSWIVLYYCKLLFGQVWCKILKVVRISILSGSALTFQRRPAEKFQRNNSV